MATCAWCHHPPHVGGKCEHVIALTADGARCPCAITAPLSDLATPEEIEHAREVVRSSVTLAAYAEAARKVDPEFD